MKKEGLLSSNQLKVIALIAMTLDHLGVQIFTDVIELRVIGRIAFPIFAYMISEGCRYTRNRKKYLLNIVGIAVLCQVVCLFVGSFYQCIFVTFSLAIILIYCFDNVKKLRNVKSGIAFLTVFCLICFLAVVLPKILYYTDYSIDYGIIGICLPLLIYMGRTRIEKIIMLIFGLNLLSIYFGGIQWFSLVSVLLLVFYNGKKGKWKMKYLFYIYYPIHLAIIYFISMCLG